MSKFQLVGLSFVAVAKCHDESSVRGERLILAPKFQVTVQHGGWPVWQELEGASYAAS